MFRIAALLAFVVALAGTLYLALTPGPLGELIESGEQRHVAAFIILPLLSAIAFPRVGMLLQWSCYAALGGAIEIAQIGMAMGRKGEWNDWFVDMLAAGVALTAVHLARRLRGPPPARLADA